MQSSGEASVHQSNKIGVYSLTGILNDRPKYTSLKENGVEEHLFYYMNWNKGLMEGGWTVGRSVGDFGGLAHR